MSDPIDLFDPAGVAPTPAPTSRRAVQAPAPALARRSAGERPASYRLPVELLEELDARTRRLDLPVSVTVAAAIGELLARDDEEITAVVVGRAATRPLQVKRRRADRVER